MYTREEQICFKKLRQAVIDMEEEEAEELANQVVEKGYSVKGAIEIGLIGGMEEVSQLYADEKYFIPDLLSCADAMYVALDILEQYLPAGEQDETVKIVIGTVEGDTHDIGKNIVALFLKSAGFQVYDLGRDVPVSTFIEKAKEYQAEIIAMSTIMTTTMPVMKKVIDQLIESGEREHFKVMIGGKPVSLKFAKEIGADGYSVNAAEAIRLVKKLAKEIEEKV